MRQINDIDKDEYCIYDGRLLNDLGYGEYFCKECGNFFKNGREIEYTEDGDIIFKRIHTNKDEDDVKQMGSNKQTDKKNKRTWSKVKTKSNKKVIIGRSRV